MSDLYKRLHGTTADSFKIGLKNQRIILTGVTNDANTVALLDRDYQKHSVESTVFFTAYIVGRGSTSTAAFQIKGCYLSGTTTVSGYVVDTYVDSAGFTEPQIQFNSSGELTLECTGVLGDIVNWTASIDFVLV